MNIQQLRYVVAIANMPTVAPFVKRLRKCTLVSRVYPLQFEI